MAADQLQIRDEREESLTEGELPSQGGGYVPTILPGRDFFRIPANVDQCWEARDYEKKDIDGNVVVDGTGKPVIEQHFLLKFDKENPLVVVGGEYDGLPAQATITTIPRRHGKKGDPKATMVHDITYLVRTSLGDKTQVTKRHEWMPIINKYAGHIIYLEHGLSAGCDPERVRYVDDGTGKSIEDPDGTKGCDHAQGMEKKAGSRLYTNDFKIMVFQDTTTGATYNTRDEAIEAGVAAASVKQVPAFVDTVTCKGCGARLRGFFRIEKFLAPLASTQQIG